MGNKSNNVEIGNLILKAIYLATVERNRLGALLGNKSYSDPEYRKAEQIVIELNKFYAKHQIRFERL